MKTLKDHQKRIVELEKELAKERFVNETHRGEILLLKQKMNTLFAIANVAISKQSI